MADYRLDDLGGRTPLEAAETPNFDTIASHGLLGVVNTVPEAFAPGSDIACLSVLGYDPSVYYTGRAPLEAASLGITLRERDWAVRCNLITKSNDTLEDFCAGHISNEEAEQIITTLNEQLGKDTIHFYAGKSYRNILIYSGERGIEADCTPPHDIIGQSIQSNLPRGNGREILIDLMMKSYEILSNHEVNKRRIALNQKPANMIWLWGQGKQPALPSFQELYHISGAVITGVDLLKGLGVFLGWDIINVPGATGYLDTDYRAKAEYAIEAFNTHDLVLIHIEAPDEAGHEGNIGEKIRAIENIDSKIVGPLYTALKKYTDFRILLLPDHYTPIEKRTHTREPVPFAMYGSDLYKKNNLSYSESNAARTNLEIPKGHTLMRYFIEGTLSSS